METNLHWQDDKKFDLKAHQKSEGYVAHKWKVAHLLPDNHPYKNSPPKKDD